MKRIHFLFFTFLAMASCQKQAPDNTGRISSGLQPGEVKIMSFNIRGYTNEDDVRNMWAMRAGAVRDMFYDQKASVIGLQECSDGTEWPYVSGVMTPKGYACLASDDPQNSILYLEDELEAIETGVFWQSDTPDKVSECWDGYPRIVRWAVFRIKANGAKFFYVDTHLGLTPESRIKAMPLIQRRISTYNTENLPVVFTADCNTAAEDSIFDIWKNSMVNVRDVAGITDRLNTYNAWGKEQKAAIIDHIWLSNTLSPSIYMTVTKQYDGHKFVSDHYPVYTVVKF